MPDAIKRPCRRNGCPLLVPGGGYCKNHPPDESRESSYARGYGGSWRRLREVVLHRQPFCRCGAPANEVDHIVPKSRGGRDTIENLQSLCKRCHSRKTAGERAGLQVTLG